MTIFYTKHFESGLLKGLSVRCQLTFATQAAADEFAKAIRPSFPPKVRKDVFSRAKYIVTEVAYQNYTR